MILQHANAIRVVILGKKGVGKSGNSYITIVDMHVHILTSYSTPELGNFARAFTRISCQTVNGIRNF